MRSNRRVLLGVVLIIALGIAAYFVYDRWWATHRILVTVVPQGPHVGIQFGGGYVFAFNGKNVLVGEVAETKENARYYHAHPMRLTLKTGKFESGEPPQTYGGVSQWDLSDYEVHIKYDKQTLGTDNLQTHKASPPLIPCDDPSSSTGADNWFYIPDIRKLATVSATASTELNTLLRTRLSLGEGTLQVNGLAKNCLDFKDQDGYGQVKQTRRAADDQHAVYYHLDKSVKSFVLNLLPTKPDQQELTIQFSPDNGVLELGIQTLSGQPAPHPLMEFFDMYYDLLVDASGKKIDRSMRLIPSIHGMVHTKGPGAECPPVSIDAP